MSGKLAKGKRYTSVQNRETLYEVVSLGPKRVVLEAWPVDKPKHRNMTRVSLSTKAAEGILEEVTDLPELKHTLEAARIMKIVHEIHE